MKARQNIESRGTIRCIFLVCSLLLFMFSGPALGAQGASEYTIDSSGMITAYSGTGGDITIPTEVNGVFVTGIGDGVFQLNKTITSVYIQAGVKSIGNMAFFGCSNLTSCTLPDGLITIGNNAFCGCTSLNNVTIPNSVTDIGSAAFSSCKSMNNLTITIPNSIKSIGNSAFNNCTGLKSFTIPSKVTKIEDNTFSGCSGLTSVMIPSGVASIGKDAFFRCTGLTDLIIPDTVTTIDSEAFIYCAGLKSLSLGNNVATIKNSAFQECTGLTSLKIPASVTFMGPLAFADCRNLKELTLAEGVKRLGNGAFAGCSSLTSVKLPNTLSVIDTFSFGYCKALNDVTIPDSVQVIEPRAFQECSALASISFPNSIKEIKDLAFNKCSSLKAANFYGNAPTMGNSVFSATASGFTVYYSWGNTTFTNPWYGYPTAVIYLTAPQLSAQPDRPAGSKVNIAFTDDENWRYAITGITVDNQPLDPGLYTVIAGSIEIAAGVLNDVKSYTVVVSATGYNDAAVIITMTDLWTAPQLSAEADQSAGSKVNIAFTDDENWRHAITGITVDNQPLDPGRYTVIAGNIEIAAGVLTDVKSYTVVVSATGYNDASVIITMTNPDSWSSQRVVLKDTPEAELMVRVGDIDNLNCGWPDNYNPFSGELTPVHGYPWTIDNRDAAGTDRIMVISSYNGNPPHGQDGYTNCTTRPDNVVKPIELQYDLCGVTVKSSVLQVFVDDFQAKVWGADYKVTVNGTRVPFIEEILNTIEQTGPVGQLITIKIPDNILSMCQSGDIKILIDDQTSGAGDGYAVDFVRLLINPANSQNLGIIQGRVQNENGEPINGAIITAQGGITKAESDSNGNYALNDVYAGLVVLQIEADGYKGQTINLNLVANETKTVDIILESILMPPALNPDSTENYEGASIDITFDDDETWRTAITGISIDKTQLTDSQYTITEGNINIAEGVLTTAGDHTIKVAATGYKEASTIQQIELLMPPALNADITDNRQGASIDIAFDDNDAWRNAITGITVDGTGLPESQYAITEGNINIAKGVLATAGDHTIIVSAKGYTDASLIQAIESEPLLMPPVLNADSAENVEGALIDIAFDDNEAWRNAITGITVDGTGLTESQYAITEGNINIAVGVLTTAGDHTIIVSATGYTDASIIQPIKKIIVPSVTLDNMVVYDTTDATYVNMKILGTFKAEPGYEILEKGFISIKNPETEPGDEFTLDANGITIVKVPKTNSAGEAYRAIKTLYGNIFHVRGYVTYRNTTTGKTTTVYSDNIVKAVKNNQ
ncbi:MAG: leucine-rich repeat protein [Syntrophomonadaceae bacterium]